MVQQQTGCVFQVDIATVVTAGTAVQLSSAGEHVRRITFRGTEGNTGNVGIGNSDVSMSSATWILKPVESITLDFSPGSVLLSDFFVDADTSGDKLDWIVGATLLTGAGTQGAIAHSATTGIVASNHHGASTTIDNEIARYNGTVGALQGYTSNGPTVSDTGVITLASGQLVFPTTQNASAGANTLDDYEEGTWTPTIVDNSGSAAELQTYTIQVGRYVKIGRLVTIQLRLRVLSFGTLTTTQAIRIGGLPFTSANITNAYPALAVGQTLFLALNNAAESVGATMAPNTVFIDLYNWDATAGVTELLLSEYSADGLITIDGSYEV